MATCLFCRIVSGEVQADVLLNEGGVLAFRDIHPQAPTHILIIPKKHVARLTDVRPEDLPLIGEIHRAVQRLAAQWDPEGRGFRLVVNNGPNAGQAVDHLHYHWLGGRPLGWPPG